MQSEKDVFLQALREKNIVFETWKPNLEEKVKTRTGSDYTLIKNQVRHLESELKKIEKRLRLF